MEQGEPLWLEEDRDYAVALQEFEDNTCDGCGEQLDVSTDPAHSHQYRLEPPTICWGCMAVRRDLADLGEDPRGPALKHRLIREASHG